MADEYLFVYGTLKRRGGSAAHEMLTQSATYVADAAFQGRLYLVSWYPAVVESDESNDQVYGEVYRLSDPLRVLERLDRYEGCGEPGAEYERHQRPVVLSTGETRATWIYLYQHSTQSLQRIESGEFCWLGQRDDDSH